MGDKAILHDVGHVEPARLDTEELQYRFYLKQKLDAAEEDVRAGRIVTHEQVVQETAKWFEE